MFSRRFLHNQREYDDQFSDSDISQKEDEYEDSNREIHSYPIHKADFDDTTILHRVDSIHDDLLSEDQRDPEPQQTSSHASYSEPSDISHHSEDYIESEIESIQRQYHPSPSPLRESPLQPPADFYNLPIHEPPPNIQRRPPVHSLSQIRTVRNTNPSDTSFSSPTPSRRSEVSHRVVTPDMNDITNIPTSGNGSSRSHYKKKIIPSVADGSYENLSSSFHPQIPTSSRRTTRHSYPETHTGEHASGRPLPTPPAIEKEPENTDPQQITPGKLLQYINQISDTIAEKIVMRQDGRKPTEPGANNSLNVTPIRNTHNNDISGIHIPSPHLSVNEFAPDSSFRRRSTNLESNATKPKSTQILESFHDDREDSILKKDYEKDYNELENFLLQLPQGASILRHYYQKQLYTGDVDIQQLNELDKKNSLKRDTSAILQSQNSSIFNNDSDRRDVRSVSLPGNGPNLSNGAMQFGQPFTTYPDENASRKVSVTFADKNQVFPHNPRYNSNESLSSAVFSDKLGHTKRSTQNGIHRKQLLEPINITKRRSKAPSFLSNVTSTPESLNNKTNNMRSPHTPPTIPSSDDTAAFETLLNDLKSQVLSMAEELKSYEEENSSFSEEIDRLRAENAKLKEENSSLEQKNRLFEEDLKETYQKYKETKGNIKPLTRERMPDAHKTRIPEARKAYNRFRLDQIDKLSLIEAHNILKHICLHISTDFPSLELRLGRMVKIVKHVDMYMDFANDIHQILYDKKLDWFIHGDPPVDIKQPPRDPVTGERPWIRGFVHGGPFGEAEQQALFEMVKIVQRLDHEHRKVASQAAISSGAVE